MLDKPERPSAKPRPPRCLLCCAGPNSVYTSAEQVFCGILARVAQFADVLRDSKEQLRQVRACVVEPIMSWGSGHRKLGFYSACSSLQAVCHSVTA